MIDSLVDWALSPLNWLLLALALAMLAWRMPSRRWLRIAAVALALVAYLAMTPLVSNRLVRRLENGFETPAGCAGLPPSAVVVLGGSVDRLPARADSFWVLSATSRRRIEQGVAYWQRHGGVIVMSGGPTAAGWIPQAELMAGYARRLGVPDQAIRLEPESRTTWENARLVAAMRPALPRRVAVATSAMHMRRALLAFGEAGLEACPLPADRQAVRAGFPGALRPDVDSLAKSEAALHEVVGNLHYEWLRRRGATH